MKDLIIKLIPNSFLPIIKKIYSPIKLKSYYNYNYKLFKNHSLAISEIKNKHQLRSLIIFNYHAIEKGMSLPKPKNGFGKDKINNLVELLGKYESSYGRDDLFYTGLTVLKIYSSYKFADERCIKNINIFLSKINFSNISRAGTLVVSKENFSHFSIKEACNFITNRHSIRNFTGETIDARMIDQIIKISQSAPSVCNRQATNIYVTNDRNKIDDLLLLQNGNSGFGHTLGALFIITVNLNYFLSHDERNQPFVDGGIYAYSLAMSIHAHKLGGCLLNWSSSPEQDIKLRKKLSIPEHHLIITFLGAGHLPDNEITVAGSPRISTQDFVNWI